MSQQFVIRLPAVVVRRRVLRHAAKRPFRSCAEGELPISVPPPMGLSLGKRFGIFLVATALVCSCDKHHPGEYPEVQRDKMHEPSPAAAVVDESRPVSSPSPAAKPTPAEFFPTKPR